MTEGTRVFCSELARAAAEPLAGTASHALGCVLLTYPKRLWGRDALDSEGLSIAAKKELERLREERDVITRLVAHEGTWTGHTEVTFFPEARRFGSVAMDDVPALLARARHGELSDAGDAVRAPIVAVCTHGQRDRCCALFGLALTDALRAAAASARLEVDVREASHLGGDRFAPTVLVLPSGHMYGHLSPDDAPALLDAALGGPPVLAKLRGSLWLEPMKQLAEIAALGLPVFRGVLPTLGAIGVTELDARRRELRASASHGASRVTVVVRCRLERRQVFGDCRNAERNRRGGVDAWVIEEARAEPA